MKTKILFCSPYDNTYTNLTEATIAKQYTSMAIDDYDKLVSFEKSYLLNAETPDLKLFMGCKDTKELFVSLFANQPITRIANIHQEIDSTSYLFNPTCNDKDLYLPDLDVVELKGNNINEAIQVIKNFYESYNWDTYIFDGKIDKKTVILPTSQRFSKPIQIYNPLTLRFIAEEKLSSYSFEDLMF